jgi:hypothetical protein
MVSFFFFTFFLPGPILPWINKGVGAMNLMKFFTVTVLFSLVLCLMGCYQAHSDDALRTIPTTNNPNIVPRSQSMGMPAI